MGGNTFQAELSKLEKLVGNLNKNKNKKNMSGGKTPDVDVRYFKVVKVDGKNVKNGGRYSLPMKTKKGKEQKRGPRDQASKAFSELCSGVKGDCKHKITLQETTQGSSKKLYHYEVKRVKLDKPVTLKLKDKKTGKVKEIVKKYKNVVKSLGSEKPEQKGGNYI